MQEKWSSMSSLTTTIIVVLIFPGFCCCTNDSRYSICSSISFNCGDFPNVGFPFWGNLRPQYCGHQRFQLHCDENAFTTIEIMSVKYRVIAFYPDSWNLKLSRLDFRESVCPPKYQETVLDYNLFNYTSADRITTLFYRCSPSFAHSLKEFNCNNNATHHHAGYLNITDNSELEEQLKSHCADSVTVPILEVMIGDLISGTSSVRDVINEGFEINYGIGHLDKKKCGGCEKSGGVCGYDQPDVFNCYQAPPPANSPKLVGGIAAAAAIFGTLSISIIVWLFVRKLASKNDEDIEASLRKHGSLALKRYSYSKIKRMTSSLKEKLGQGGYGGVYKGKLPDGRLVAVKILKKSNGNGEEFINEVASISRTSHVNVVNLYGFCFEGHKRALIYEFMPNGSLEKFLVEDGSHLGLEKLYQIASGIARGLEYLHHGCNTRILHLDIKPHNILLDEEFCPKIADFGLAKLCSTKDSIEASILGARGTIGYIAPEVFSRNFGRVSRKSDIYSYGIMILEIVGGKKNIVGGVSQSSEMCFPDWFYKRIEVQNESTYKEGVVMDEEEEKLAKKMILVGLWCIQTDPLQRPSISKVIDMLEGSIEALEIPPVPALSPPPRPSDSDTDAGTAAPSSYLTTTSISVL